MRSSFIDTAIEALPCRSICYRRDLAVGDGIREVSNPPNSADPRGRRVGPVRGKPCRQMAAARRTVFGRWAEVRRQGPVLPL